MTELQPKQFSSYITPERRHEVENAMPPVYVGSSPNAAQSARCSPDNPQGAAGKLAIGRMKEQHHVARMLMQSDVPVADLAGLDSIRTGQRLTNNAAAQHVAAAPDYKTMVSGGASEHIQSMRRYSTGTEHPPRADRDTYQRELVHEIGHHVDYRDSPQDVYGSVPAKEAMAENYADAHVVTRTPATSVYDKLQAGTASTHGRSGTGFGKRGDAVYLAQRTPKLEAS